MEGRVKGANLEDAVLQLQYTWREVLMEKERIQANIWRNQRVGDWWGQFSMCRK